MVCPFQKPARRAYTLLELILALSLTTVVLLIVTTGISVQLHVFDTSRQEVERVQLARVLLHQMANDLRNAIAPDESSGGSSGNSSDATATLGEDGTESDTLDLVDFADGGTSTTPSAPGIYGELGWLRVDIVRAVRRDATAEAASPSTDSSTQAMRQIETIVYYVVSATDQTATGLASTDDDSSAGGLVRRELVRPMAAWAAERGQLEYQDLSVAPLAREVSAVEFRYHDGTDWLEEWDTETAGSLPKAIEITLFLPTVSTSQSTGTASSTSNADSLDESAEVSYRLVVSLPLAGDSKSTDDESLDSILDESSMSGLGSTGGTSSTGGTEP